MTAAAVGELIEGPRSYLSDSWATHDRLDFDETARRVAARLSHTEQQTPLSVAVQGFDGSGKTTFMRLICHALAESRACWTVWYEPWRFDEPRDVWRGLIYELTDALEATPQSSRSWRPFARNLMERRWSYDLLQAAEDEDGGPEVTRQFSRYLAMVTDRLKRQRGATTPLVVVFLDDLDRCSPACTTAVLQASTLLLNSRGFVTVFGLTPGAFNSIGRSDASVNGNASLTHAERFFQIALQVPTVSRAQFRKYVSHCVDLSHTAVEGRWIDVLAETLFPSPRDVKRFLNYLISEWDKAEAARLLPLAAASAIAGNGSTVSPEGATTATPARAVGTPSSATRSGSTTAADEPVTAAALSQFVFLALLVWRYPEVGNYLRSDRADPEAFDRLIRASLRVDAEETAAEDDAGTASMSAEERQILATPGLQTLLVRAFSTATRGNTHASLVSPFRSNVELGNLLFHFRGAPESAAEQLEGARNPKWAVPTSLQEARDRRATLGGMAAAKWSRDLLRLRDSGDEIMGIRAYREQARNNQQMGLEDESYKLATEAHDIASKKLSGPRLPLGLAEAHLALSEHFAAFSPLRSALEHANNALLHAREAKEPNIELQALIASTYALKLDWQNEAAIAGGETALELDRRTGGSRSVPLHLLLAELHHRQARQFARASNPVAKAASDQAALGHCDAIQAAIANGSREERQRYERLRRRLDPSKPNLPVAFISYSHKNAEAFRRVRDILRPWADAKTLHVWEDTQIQVGALWQLEIESALEDATHAILLASREYDDSEFIRWVERPRINAMFNRGDIALLIIPLSGEVARSTLSGIQFLLPRALDGLTGNESKDAWDQIRNRLADALQVKPGAAACNSSGAAASTGAMDGARESPSTKPNQ